MRRIPIGAATIVLLLASSCSGGRFHAPVQRLWVAGCVRPSFDPDGPPNFVRFALERLLSHGLVERGPGGSIRKVEADSVWTSPDGRTLGFRLRPGLAFTDGSPVTSADYRAALLAGLGRTDHGTRAWLLAAVSGADRVRAGAPLPELGVETPDSRTLVLHLAHRDSLLLDKLATPGVLTAWRRRDAADWRAAIGTGPYRIVREARESALVFARASGAPGDALADTIVARFMTGSARARAQLRARTPDLLWPVPPAFFSQPVPAGYRLERADANPVRRLLLVLRADVPPTTRLAARHALAHALNHEELLQALGPRGRASEGWLPGGGSFDYPSFDARQTREWMVRGRLGASFHVVLGFDADQAGAEIARVLQGAWARLGIYAELRPARGAAAGLQQLAATAAQAQLVDVQAPFPGAAAELATLVMPVRGPAIGAVRTGWRTREFDSGLLPGERPRAVDAAGAQRRLEQERIVLPLAELPWIWIVRDRPGIVAFDPAFGPQFVGGAEDLPSGHVMR